MLKRASAVSHPESEPQKRVALDTEQDPTRQPRFSYGIVGVRCATQRQHYRRLARAKWPQQEVRNTMMMTSRWMETVRTTTVQDTQTRRDQTAGGGSRRRGNHVKSEWTNQASLNSACRESSSGRRLPEDLLLLSPRRRHWTGPVRKQ